MVRLQCQHSLLNIAFLFVPMHPKIPYSRLPAKEPWITRKPAGIFLKPLFFSGRDWPTLSRLGDRVSAVLHGRPGRFAHRFDTPDQLE
jgi:hypothetical protein